MASPRRRSFCPSEGGKLLRLVRRKAGLSKSMGLGCSPTACRCRHTQSIPASCPVATEPRLEGLRQELAPFTARWGGRSRPDAEFLKLGHYRCPSELCC